MSRKTVSEKQLAANRRNAMKSTGPRTQEGKARSRRNAVKHGILSQEVMIRAGDGAEDPAQFEDLLEQLREEFQPKGVLEAALVERISVCYWRLRRAQRFEVGAIREQLDECTRSPQRTGIRTAERDLKEASGVLAYEQRMLEWAKGQKDFTTPGQGETIDLTWEGLMNRLDLPGIDLLHTPLERQACLAHLQARYRSPAQMRERFIEDQRYRITQTEARVEVLRTRLAQERYYYELARERAVLANVLPDESNLNKLIRYESMIDRQLNRALDQLEQLQGARYRGHVAASAAVELNLAEAKKRFRA